MSSWGAVQLSKLPRPMRMLFREVVRNSIISFERSIRNALRRITDVRSAPARALFGGGTALRRRCTHTGGVLACRLSSVVCTAQRIATARPVSAGLISRECSRHASSPNLHDRALPLPVVVLQHHDAVLRRKHVRSVRRPSVGRQ